MSAIEAGGCPNLKRLDVEACHLNSIAATNLSHALASGRCRQQEWLHLKDGFDNRLGSLRVLEGIKHGLLPELRYLNLESVEMDQDHSRVLGDAIMGGVLPKLEQLLISGNPLWDRGVEYIMSALQQGGCPGLKELEISNVDMGVRGGRALALALASGHLSSLQLVKFVQHRPVIGDNTMSQIIRGFQSCQQMEAFDVYSTGMGEEAGQALLETLLRGPWLYLKRIELSSNRDLGNDVVGMGLAEVLERNKFPRLQTLNVYRTGLSQEGVDRLLGVIEKGACPMLGLVSMDRDLVSEEWMTRLKGRCLLSPVW